MSPRECAPEDDGLFGGKPMTPKRPRRALLIDGDVWAYQIASSCEKAVEWDTDFWTLHCDFHEARDRLKDKLFEIKEELGADEIHVALSDRENFRKTILPTYKAHRAKVRKPVCLVPLREYLEEIGVVWMYPTLEGDDVLGILSTHPTLIKADEKIIVSIDKDMKGVPGLLLNDGEARKGMAENPDTTLRDYIRRVTEDEADRWHLIQTIAGDATDGYSGVPGLGVVTAARMLDAGRKIVAQDKVISRGPRKGQVEKEYVEGDPASPWEIVVSIYESRGLSAEMALQMARVAHILRAEDFNIETEEVRLWTPT